MAEPPKILKPPALVRGARVTVVAPASSAKPERVTAGMESLKRRGFRAEAAAHAFGKRPPYFSGSVAERIGDIAQGFSDPEIGALLCTRGGYGSNYLLTELPLVLMAEHPKAFFGYSDFTSLQTYLLDRIGLVGFHGPMVAADWYLADGVDEASFQAAVSGGRVRVGPQQGMRALRPGTARGTVYGGCLSLLTAALGTRYAPQTEGKLLFLEDVAAKPYQVDRMLRHMVLAGKFEGVKGFIFGEMLDCVSPGADPDLLERVVLEVLAGFDVPIAFGLRSGHVSRGCVTLPLGIEAELRLEGEPVLEYLESAVGD